MNQYGFYRLVQFGPNIQTADVTVSHRERGREIFLLRGYFGLRASPLHLCCTSALEPKHSFFTVRRQKARQILRLERRNAQVLFESSKPTVMKAKTASIL